MLFCTTRKLAFINLKKELCKVCKVTHFLIIIQENIHIYIKNSLPVYVYLLIRKDRCVFAMLLKIADSNLIWCIKNAGYAPIKFLEITDYLEILCNPPTDMSFFTLYIIQ